MKYTLAIPAFFLYVTTNPANTSWHPLVILLFWLTLVMAIDLITGIWKSIILKRRRTSTGFQRTVTKVMKYMGTVIIAYMMQRILPIKTIDLPYNFPLIGKFIEVSHITYFWIFFLIYIEVLSIFENFIEMYKKDKKDMLYYMIVLIHNVLSIKFKNIFQPQKITSDEKESMA